MYVCITGPYLTCLDQKTDERRLHLVSLSIIGYSYIANFGEINENVLKKNIRILNDRRRISVPYFSSIKQ